MSLNHVRMQLQIRRMREVLANAELLRAKHVLSAAALIGIRRELRSNQPPPYQTHSGIAPSGVLPVEQGGLSREAA